MLGNRLTRADAEGQRLRDGARWLALGAAWLLLGCGGSPESDTAAPRPLVLGLVPSLEAEKLITNLQPLGEFLEGELGVPVRTFVPQDYTGLIEALGSGQADIGMLPPFAAVLGAERYGIEPLLVSVRDGQVAYRAQWMSADPELCDAPPEPDSRGMRGCSAPLASVAGRSVAFTSPTSTSGYLFPALQLIELGIDPERDIRPVFVGGHDAAVIAVLNGDVEIAVAYEDARTYIRDQYPDIGERVFPFHYSDWIPNDGVQVRADLPTELKRRIREALLELTERESALPQAERLLYKLYEIDGFVPFEEGVYEPVARAFRAMRDAIDIDG